VSGGIAPVFLTQALDEREWSHALTVLSPRKEPPVSIVYEAGWAPYPVWTQW